MDANAIERESTDSTMLEPSLQELQRWMAAQIRPRSGSTASVEGETILNTQRGTAGAERLAVYASGYLARAREALLEAYEAVHYVVGESAFSSLAMNYAERYPSHDYNLSVFGRHLPELLKCSPLAQHLPFLRDLACLEWAVREAFHAFDQLPLGTDRLFSLSLEEWERSRLIFQPSVSAVASSWPILDIWTSRTQPRRSLNVDLKNRPQQVLVYRNRGAVTCELMNVYQKTILKGLLAGRTLGDVCAEVAEMAGDADLPLADWFSSWARCGLITRCELVNEPIADH